LLAAAQRLQRPQSELDALTDSNTKIAALAAQLRGVKAGDKAKANPLLAQMNSLATAMSQDEATALDKAAGLMWRDMEKPPGKTVAADAAAATAAATQAKAKLDAAIASAQQARDGAGSLKGAQQALTAYGAFASAYGAAVPFYISARRSDFTTLSAAAHTIADKLETLGRVSKPSWLFASRARKDAYQTLVDNATQAQSQIAQVDALEQRVNAANDLRKVSAALARASTIKARLNGLLTTSNAAYNVYSQ
jgi:hypothetical protein